MTDIREFLLAALAEDEQVAQAAHDEEVEWVADDVAEHGIPDSGRHIRRHLPSRVLAEIAAKRRILAETDGWHHYDDDDRYSWCGKATDPEDICSCGLDGRRDRITRLLAAPYRSESGWDPHWEVTR